MEREMQMYARFHLLEETADWYAEGKKLCPAIRSCMEEISAGGYEMNEDYFRERLNYIAWVMESVLPQWREYEEQLLSWQEQEASINIDVQKDNAAHTAASDKDHLAQFFLEMNTALEKKGLSAQTGLESAALEKNLVKCFAMQLGKLSQQDNTHAKVYQAVQEGRKDAENEIRHLEKLVREWVLHETDIADSKFLRQRTAKQWSNAELEARLKEWREEFSADFEWSANMEFPGWNLAGIDVIAVIRQIIHQSFQNYGASINQSINAWRLILIRQYEADQGRTGGGEAAPPDLDQIRMRRRELEVNYQGHIKRVREMKDF